MFQQSLESLRRQTSLRSRYDNFIGGEWVAPAKGQYFVNNSPINDEPLCEVARSTAEAQEMADMAGCGALDLSSWQTEAFPITRINEGLEFVAARQGGFVNAVVTIAP